MELLFRKKKNIFVIDTVSEKKLPRLQLTNQRIGKDRTIFYSLLFESFVSKFAKSGFLPT